MTQKFFAALFILSSLSIFSHNAEAAVQKIEKSKCLEIQQWPDDGRINITVSSSRLSFHIDQKTKNYVAFKAILLDSCNPKTKKHITFSFDEKSQEIIALAYAGK